MKNCWYPLKDYEGFYEITREGHIRSIDRFIREGRTFIKGKVMTPHIDYKGYVRVHLSKNGKNKGERVHRLIAKTFIENPENLPEVNHIDSNKQNNSIENLEWVTTKQNSEHFFTKGNYKERNAKLSRENNPRARLTWNDVHLIRKLKEEYNFKNKTLSWLFDISVSQIKMIVSYRQWKLEEI